jgi:TRAP-type C4-dicarboxylate transport system permease small subunit
VRVERSRHPAAFVLRLLARVIDLSVILIGAALIMIVLLNVILHVFSVDLAWVTELGEFMMIWVTFLGGVAAARRNAHMSITELLDKLAPSKRRWADVAIQALCIFILALLFIYGLRIVSNGWGSVLTTLGWPMAWQYMPLPLAAVLMMIFQGRDLVLALKGVPPRDRDLAA